VSQSLISTSFVEVSVVQIERDEVRAVDVGMDYSVTSMTYIDCYNLVATGDQMGTIASWDLSSGKKVLECVQKGCPAFACERDVTRLRAKGSVMRLRAKGSVMRLCAKQSVMRLCAKGSVMRLRAKACHVLN
jgi:WD40 repeat protein